MFCQHIHTQTRDYTSHVFVSRFIHKHEITLPVFVCQQIHTQTGDYTSRVCLSAYTYTNRRLHFPCFCQHIHYTNKRLHLPCICQHIHTQTRDYTSHDFVSICIHKQEITLPMFLSADSCTNRRLNFQCFCQHIHYTNKRLLIPCFCQHIHTQIRDYSSHVFVSIYIHKQDILLFPIQEYANKDRHDTSLVFVFSICL
jgi:hypothetical protein